MSPTQALTKKKRTLLCQEERSPAGALKPALVYSSSPNKRTRDGNKRGMGNILRTQNKRGLGNPARLNQNKGGMGKILRTQNKMGLENLACPVPNKTTLEAQT